MQDSMLVPGFPK